MDPHHRRRERWLLSCLPVIVQPVEDIRNGNGLLKVFYEFTNAQGEKTDQFGCNGTCKLVLVFGGEASYERFRPKVQNHLATFFYRSYNHKVYKRTADVNYVDFVGVNFDALHTTGEIQQENQLPWREITTGDGAGSQTWSQGSKFNIGPWFTLMHHYRVSIHHNNWALYKNSKYGSQEDSPRIALRSSGSGSGGDMGVPLMEQQQLQHQNRPLIYLNTCNHMMGEEDNNGGLDKFYWTKYEVDEGSAADAELYARTHAPPRFTCFSLLPGACVQ